MHNARFLAPVALLALTVAAGPASAKEKPTLPKDLPPYGAERPLPVPQITTLPLANGLTVWLLPRPGFPKTTALLAVRGGTAADPRELPGISEVFGDALKEGTQTRSARAIAEELQAVGGEIDVTVSNDATLVSVDGLASGTAKLLEVLADVAQAAAFPAKEVELVKENTLQGLAARASTPEFAVDKAFAAAVFGDHPYRTVAPAEQAIQAVTPQLLKEEYARRFRPERALLVVAGAFDAAAVSEQIKKLLGGWRARGAAGAATPPAPPAPERRILIVDRPGSVQSEIRVGRPTVRATDPDYYKLLVANTIFGGAFSSRLVENIREDKGYTYSPGSRAQTFEQGGMLRIRAAVRNEVTAATLLEIFYELDRMAATLPTDDELMRAKHFQSGLYLLRNETSGALAYTLATNWVNGLPPAALGEFVTRVNAVTAADVRQVGGKLLTSSSQTVVIGGDAKTVAAEVAPFGQATVAK